MFGEIEAEAAPAGADIEHALARFESELRREVPFLGKLGFLDGGIAVLEIGAGILQVVVEEERIEPSVEIIMCLDVPAGADRRVHLTERAA